MSAYNPGSGRQPRSDQPTTAVENDKDDSAHTTLYRRPAAKPIINEASSSVSVTVVADTNNNAQGSQSPPTSLVKWLLFAKQTLLTTRPDKRLEGNKLASSIGLGSLDCIREKNVKPKSDLDNNKRAKVEAEKKIAYQKIRITALELGNARLEEAHEEDKRRLLQAERKDKELDSLKRQFDQVQTDFAEIQEMLARARRNLNGVNTFKSPKNQEESEN
ncbi:hypothetical protein NX059_012262 [Plenodomus lindquistii]|nr:hypothetical protein NX059_012262 [Plenodomus lindquistii]